MKKVILILLSVLALVSGISALDLDLDRFLELVEENNKDLYNAELDEQIAEAQRKLARSAALPIIAGSLGYTRNFEEILAPVPVAAIPISDPNLGGAYPLQYADVPYNKKNDFTAGVQIQQKVFDMTVFQALKASSKYTELAGTVYEATRQGILTGAKQLYFQCVLLEEVYRVKEEAEKNAYETYQDILGKYENELVSELNVLQAEVNWQISRPETTQAARNWNLALNNLKVLGGIGNDEDLVLTDRLSNIPDAPESTDLGQILSARQDYQILRQQEDLMEINKNAIRAEFFPSLSLSVTYGWQDSNDAFRWEEGTDSFTAGLSLTIPVFYGGSRFAKLEKARLELEQSRMEVLKKQDGIQAEITNLQLLLEESSSRLDSAKTTIATAEKAFSIMQISAESGISTQLELKDARLNMSNATLNYYAAVFDYLNAYFQWQQATGQGDVNPFL